MSPGGNSTWDKESCSHQETRCFPPTSPRGSNPTHPHLQLHFSCCLGSTLQLWRNSFAVLQSALTSHFPAHRCTPALPSSTPPLPGAEEQGGPRNTNPRDQRLVNALCRVQVKRMAFPFLINRLFGSLGCRGEAQQREVQPLPCRASLARASSCSFCASCTFSSVAESTSGDLLPCVSSRSLVSISFICRSRWTSSCSWATSSRSSAGGRGDTMRGSE